MVDAEPNGLAPHLAPAAANPMLQLLDSLSSSAGTAAVTPRGVGLVRDRVPEQARHTLTPLPAATPE